VALREATLYDSILKLHPAADKTTTNICGYDLLTEDVPFAVNDLGKRPASELASGWDCSRISVSVAAPTI